MGTINGDVNTRPQHEVYLDSFNIDQTEITNYQYSQCVKSQVCTQPLGIGSSSRSFYYSNLIYNFILLSTLPGRWLWIIVSGVVLAYQQKRSGKKLLGGYRR